MEAIAGKRRGRLAVVLASCVVAAMALVGSPAAASSGSKLVVEEFFFKGDGQDIINKLVGEQPTFDQAAPEGGDYSVQHASVLNVAHDVGAAVWVGDFSGTVDGPMDLTLYTAAPIAAQGWVRVYADPDGANTLLGEAMINLFSGGTPAEFGGEPAATANELTVNVSGTVAEKVLVRVVPDYMQVPVYYGSEAYPSSFRLPTVVPCEQGDSDPQCQ